ncbi:hypothetical protein GCM10011575_45100 [Microlunatus endophyticus]|uniref:Zinicin-like metallopeptidase n=1 Tax=Microlunatus endophyticus TaxID=1716077 RepID=A0A917SH59_9ACTN|nr:metallopeptidase family protein [Microlunatus endophyticus]GGL81792.1 hypothetical protein GCM10011575_45100 [Microlunatus endophyticus]
MSTRRRDRHGRGLRGPLATTNPLTGTAVEPVGPPGRATFFEEALQASIDRVQAHCPEALVGIVFGVEEVPFLQTAWSGEKVPLAAAVAPTPAALGRVVLYRRPLEHRAATRPGLQILVHRTLVEQLAALTGLSIGEIDPDADDED